MSIPDSVVPPSADVAGDVTRRRRRQRMRLSVALSVGWIGLLVVVAVFASLLPIADYDKTIGSSLESPGFRWPEPLGTDRLGRSILSRVIFGARVSLSVGLLGTLLALFVGGLAGLVAAQYRGIVRAVIDVLSNAVLAIPPIVFLLAIVAALQPRLTTLVISLSMLVLPTFARLTKANAVAQMGREYVLAAQAMGATRFRILLRELLPNAFGPVMAYSFLVMANLMVAEGALSFLGLGVPPPNPTWGGMIAAGQGLMQTKPWPVIIPSLCLFTTVLALNTIGDALQARMFSKGSKL